MLIATYGNQEYALLGKLLFQKKPEIAQELLSTYLTPKQENVESDYSKINSYFKAYCEAIEINPDEYYYYGSKKHSRITRIFIAAMVHIYNPQILQTPVEKIKMKNIKTGFVKNLAFSLNRDKSIISKMLKDVVIWEREYDDFANSVTQILQILVDNGNEKRKN